MTAFKTFLYIKKIFLFLPVSSHLFLFLTGSSCFIPFLLVSSSFFLKFGTDWLYLLPTFPVLYWYFTIFFTVLFSYFPGPFAVVSQEFLQQTALLHTTSYRFWIVRQFFLPSAKRSSKFKDTVP